jgi:hypothetical protein
LVYLYVAKFPEVLWKYALGCASVLYDGTHLVTFHAQCPNTTFQLYLFRSHLHDLLPL